DDDAEGDAADTEKKHYATDDAEDDPERPVRAWRRRCVRVWVRIAGSGSGGIAALWVGGGALWWVGIARARWIRLAACARGGLLGRGIDWVRGVRWIGRILRWLRIRGPLRIFRVAAGVGRSRHDARSFQAVVGARRRGSTKLANAVPRV